MSGAQESNNDQGGEGPDDMSMTDILFQFIPFYGQGNSSNDSTVRAALSSLSIEDIDSRDDNGNTLLLWACMYCCEDLARIMLNKGADPNAINSSGACCLHFACYGESASIKIAKGLLQNGANPEIQESTYGCTPLHYCASNGNVEFCKLLLSHGALINTVDFYNYTCVDYARQASMADAAVYLQQRLDKYLMQYQYGNNMLLHQSSQYNLIGGSMLGYNNMYQQPLQQYQQQSPQQMYAPEGNPATGASVNDWSAHLDPSSGGVYYVSSSSGETLWEYDWKIRMQAVASQGGHVQPPPPTTLDPAAAVGSGRNAVVAMKAGKRGNDMPEQSSNSALIVDPSKPFWKGLSISTKGSDVNMPSASSKLPISPAHAARGGGGGAGYDPATVSAIISEEKAKIESQILTEKMEFQKLIDDKDVQIARIMADLAAAKKIREATQGEYVSIQNRYNAAQISGNEEMRRLEDELAQIQALVGAAQLELTEIQQELTHKTDKITNTRNTITNLTSSVEDRVAREREVAAERERIARERKQKHEKDCEFMKEALSVFELKSSSDLEKLESDLKKKETDRRAMQTEVKQTKEAEIDTLTKELTERKAAFAEALAKATAEASECRRTAEDAIIRLGTAETLQRQLEPEVLEARQIQMFNAQLHKDFGREQLARKRLHNEMEDLKGKIRIYIRFRPLSAPEVSGMCSEAAFRDGKLSAVVKTSDGNKKVFDFDQVYGGTDSNSQADVFKDARNLITSVMDGFNVCIFAYGQTGAGKTYTMLGGIDIGMSIRGNGEFEESAGILPRAIGELFRLLQERNAQCTFVVEVQMLQVYLDNVDDLLAERKRKGKPKAPSNEEKLKIILAEHSSTGMVQVEGAETKTAANAMEVLDIFAQGAQNRVTAATELNAESSRSHLICTLTVKLTNRRSNVTTLGKLTLVDLAGSERLDKSGAVGEELKEAQSINQSLLALGDVVSALTSDQPHIPYRNHTLTMLMSDSIGGNAKTIMFINCSPADRNVQETLSSLGFGAKCKDVGLAAGPAVQAAQLNNLKKELAKLKKSGGGMKAGGLGRPM